METYHIVVSFDSAPYKSAIKVDTPTFLQLETIVRRVAKYLTEVQFIDELEYVRTLDEGQKEVYYYALVDDVLKIQGLDLAWVPGAADTINTKEKSVTVAIIQQWTKALKITVVKEMHEHQAIL